MNSISKQDHSEVLFLSSDWPPIPGGISNYLSNLCNHSNYEMTVLTPSPDWFKTALDEKEGNHSGVKLIRADSLLNRMLYRFKMSRPYFFSRNIRRFVHTHQVPKVIVAGQMMVPGWAAYRYYKKTGTPYILISHGMEFIQYANNPLTKNALLKILHNAAAVIANSRSTKKQLHSIWREGK